MIPIAVLIVTLMSLSFSDGYMTPTRPVSILLEIDDGETGDDNKLPFLLAIAAILISESNNQAMTTDNNVRMAVSSTNTAMLGTNMMGMMVPSMSSMMVPICMITIVISIATTMIEQTMTPTPTPMTTPAPGPTTCPANWERIGNSCYMFILDAMVTWQMARDMCNMADPNGKLAEIETDAENTNIVTRLGDPALGAVWIGGQDLNSDDVWVWDSTGQDITNGFVNWDVTPVQFPTTNIGNPSPAECMAIFRSQGMRWRNFDCSTTQGYICEITLDV